MKRQLMSMIAGSAALVVLFTAIGANAEPLTPSMVPPMLSGIELTHIFHQAQKFISSLKLKPVSTG